jgi:hypothetical protein
MFRHVCTVLPFPVQVVRIPDDGAEIPHAAELAPRLSSQVASLSRTEQEPTRDRSRSREDRSRTACLRAGAKHTLRTWTGAGQQRSICC